jgi:hypothetical protein
LADEPEMDAFEAAYEALAVDETTPDVPEAPATEDNVEVDDDAETQPEPDDAPEGDAEGDADAEGEGQPDDGEQDDEEPSSPRTPIAVDDDDTITLPDGTEITVKDAALRQQDYTKKTQQLAKDREAFDQEREQVEQRAAQADELYQQINTWYEDRASDPAGWVAEIAESSGNPTYVLAQTIKALGEQGRLDPKFVETFGINAEDSPVRAAAERGAEDDRIRRIEQRFEQQEQQSQSEREKQQRLAEYRQQYQTVVESYGLEFASADDERAFKKSVVDHAAEQGIDRFDVAYRSWAFEQGKAPKAPEKPVAPNPKKRASRAVTPRSSGSVTKTEAPTGPVRVEDAASAALDAFAARAS